MIVDIHKIKREKTKLWVIFTDLDDTLLDENYQYKEAMPVLRELKEKNIPVVFCSAKTYAEQSVLLKEMDVKDPFIVEDGSAIYLPRSYFKETRGKIMGDYEVILLGVESGEIKKEIELLRKKRRIKSYCTMSVEEVAEEMGLDTESAKRAKNRQFTETIIEADQEALEELKKKFNVVLGGRATQVFGKGADKGKAVKILTEMYKEFGKVTTIGMGNSFNDEPMLRAVDKPVLVKNPDGNWADIAIDGLYKATGIGPKGWCESIKKFMLGEGNE